MKKFCFILSSRNDYYCGESRDRLTNTLNFLGLFLSKLNLINDSECIVTDWGSEEKFIYQKIELNEYIKKIIKFIVVPNQISDLYNDNSEFSESHALNCAYRKSNSKYIIKIDQDTILGPSLIDWLSSTKKLPSVSFSTRRNLNEKQSSDLSSYIISEEKYNEVDIDNPDYAFNKFVNNSILPFFGGRCGVFILESEIFNNYRGFNEDLIYQNHLVIDFINRLSPNYSIYNLGLKLNFDVYHQHHPIQPQSSRASNSILYRKNILRNYNKDDWGLFNEKLEIYKF